MNIFNECDVELESSVDIFLGIFLHKMQIILIHKHWKASYKHVCKQS